MNTAKRSGVLLITTDKAAARTLSDRCAAIGIALETVSDVGGLKVALGDAAGYDVVVFDLHVKAESAKKIYDFVLSKVPVRCRFLATAESVDSKAMEHLELTRRLTRLDVPLIDADDHIRKACGAAAGPAKYDINLINCFVTSANEVLEYYTGEKPTHDRPLVSSKKTTPPGFVTSLVRFDGKSFAGAAAFTCDRNLLIEIASRINGSAKKKVAEDRTALTAAAEEMSDQIFGKAELLLGKIGYPVQMGSPEIHLGEQKPIVIEGPAPFIVLPFQIEKNKLYVGFSLHRK